LIISIGFIIELYCPGPLKKEDFVYVPIIFNAFPPNYNEFA